MSKMHNKGMRKRRPLPWIALVLLVLGILVALYISACRVGGCKSHRLETLWTNAHVRPEWNDSPAPSDVIVPDVQPEQARIYLDLSSPMGGYIPPYPDSVSLLREISQNIETQLLVHYGGIGISLQWIGVAEGLRPLGGLPRFKRDQFRGGESNLGLALEQIVSDLHSRRADVGVLVSDLMATAAGGPVDLLPRLRKWLSEDVRSGQFDLALVGAKLDYWGISDRSCRADPPMGCWFHETDERYVPLDSTVNRPVYFLMFGRRIEGSQTLTAMIGEIDNAIDELLQRSSNSRRESESEIFTASIVDFETEIEWRPDKDQYALFVSGESGQYQCPGAGRLRCRADGKVRLLGKFQAESGDGRRGFVGESIRLLTHPSSVGASEALTAEIGQSAPFLVTIDCSMIRRDRLAFAVTLEAKAKIIEDLENRWNSWSSIQERADKTFNLLPLVNNLRSQHSYQIKADSLFVFQN